MSRSGRICPPSCDSKVVFRSSEHDTFLNTSERRHRAGSVPTTFSVQLTSHALGGNDDRAVGDGLAGAGDIDRKEAVRAGSGVSQVVQGNDDRAADR